jgi:hypothetical protein
MASQTKPAHRRNKQRSPINRKIIVSLVAACGFATAARVPAASQALPVQQVDGAVRYYEGVEYKQGETLPVAKARLIA